MLSTSSPTSVARRASRETGERSAFATAISTPSLTGRSRSSWPGRTRAQRFRSAVARASATRASGVCARARSGTCAPATYTARRARWSAPVSTRPRARSKSNCDPLARNIMDSLIESPLTRLTPEQLEELGREFDAIHDDVFAELGERDRKYITSMIEMHRRMVVVARVLLFASRYKSAWVAGTTMLSLAKILENMEIGHNVMHGQWDWMNDPYINSSTWDWDSASTAEAWKHSHNYIHHTYTNIRGKDRDLGYEIMRIDPHQKWNPVYLFQPVYNILLALQFEWGVAMHDLDFDAIKAGEKSKAQIRRELKGIARKGRQQIIKDYVAFPAVSGLVATGVELALAAARSAQERKSRTRRLLG